MKISQEYLKYLELIGLNNYYRHNLNHSNDNNYLDFLDLSKCKNLKTFIIHGFCNINNLILNKELKNFTVGDIFKNLMYVKIFNFDNIFINNLNKLFYIFIYSYYNSNNSDKINLKINNLANLMFINNEQNINLEKTNCRNLVNYLITFTKIFRRRRIYLLNEMQKGRAFHEIQKGRAFHEMQKGRAFNEVQNVRTSEEICICEQKMKQNKIKNKVYICPRCLKNISINNRINYRQLKGYIYLFACC